MAFHNQSLGPVERGASRELDSGWETKERGRKERKKKERVMNARCPC